MTTHPTRRITYRGDGSVEREVYSQNGQRHRADGPAYIEYRRDGSVSLESYYLKGQLHRVGGPAYIRYDWMPAVMYLQHDALHRVGGPAYISYYDGGRVRREAYYIRHLLHREDGPASIGYDEEGSVEQEDYYLHGVHKPGVRDQGSWIWGDLVKWLTGGV